MPYPVLPPDLPPVVYPSQSESDTAVASSAVSSPVSSDSAAAVSEFVAPQPALAAQPSLPEVSPPESFSASIAPPLDASGLDGHHHEAAQLGPPLAVGLSSTDAITDAIAPAPPWAQPSTLQAGVSSPLDLPSATASYQFSAVPVAPAFTYAQAPQTPGDTEPRTPTDPAAEPGSGPAIPPERPVLEIPTDPAFPPAAPPAPPESNSPQVPQPGTTGPVPVNLNFPVVELTADRQEYDVERRIFVAEGNVVMRYGGAVLDADILQANLVDRIAVAEGNAALTRGEQVLRGQRLEYNLVQESGAVESASGEVYLPSTSDDFDIPLPTDVSAGSSNRPPSDRETFGRPTAGVATTGGLDITVGGAGEPFGQQGEVRRLRFEAERIEFTSDQWIADNVRITNDPFSPPELELRADRAIVNRISPFEDEILLTRPRLVFDQGFSLPLLRNRIVLDRRQDRSPALVNIGFDQEDRGGLFIERSFDVISTRPLRLRLTPQVLLQRAISDAGFGSLDSYGLIAQVDGTLSPTTTYEGRAVFNTLDSDDFENELRASLRLNQLIPTGLGIHNLGLEYTYRDRLFNGSLGFQDVQQSLGAVLTSPVIPLGDSGINLSYQAGAQYITANTDRRDLLEPVRTNNRVSLGRFQTSAALSRGFSLWRGQPLPPTREEGLKYTPRPVVPFLRLVTGLRGVGTFYTNGDTQNVLTGTVGIQGQFGHFSRPFLDYTAFNLTYSKSLVGGQSPFLFDRIVDDNVLSAGISQQLYGPFRLGVQTSINLDTGRDISTNYVLEYSRRTYGITLRYNPRQEIGSLNLRISDFNWAGGTEAFGGSGVPEVEGGVIRRSRD